MLSIIEILLIIVAVIIKITLIYILFKFFNKKK